MTAWSPPRLKVNNEDLIESDIVIDAGSRLVLTCEGDGPVTIVPQLAKHKKYSKANGTRCNFTVSKTASEFTGTYKCVYTGINSSNFSSVYIFIRSEYGVYCGLEKWTG